MTRIRGTGPPSTADPTTKTPTLNRNRIDRTTGERTRDVVDLRSWQTARAWKERQAGRRAFVRAQLLEARRCIELTLTGEFSLDEGCGCVDAAIAPAMRDLLESMLEGA